VDPSDIENTDDWLGCPTPLETCQHQLRMYENEIQELTLQLRQERERIFKLVKMHTESVKECETLRGQARHLGSGEPAAGNPTPSRHPTMKQKAAIAQLEIHASNCENNAAIQEQEGQLEDVANSRSNAADFRQAIEALEAE